MSFQLVKQALRGRRPPPRLWHSHALKEQYEVVIVGGGVHALAGAYYLAKDHGVTDIAVIISQYLGEDDVAGHYTTVIANQQPNVAGIDFYHEGIALFSKLTSELDFNVLFSQRGALTLAHSYQTENQLRSLAEMNRLRQVDNVRLLVPDEIIEMCPLLPIQEQSSLPILAGLYHPYAGLIHQDALIWAYARAASQLGVHIHQETEITDILIEQNRLSGLQTKRGIVHTELVLNTVMNKNGVLFHSVIPNAVPLQTFHLRMAVTEPLKPVLNEVLISQDLQVFVCQTDGGELLMGQMGGNIMEDERVWTVSELTARVLSLLPALHHVHVSRHWTERWQVPKDHMPLMGFTSVKGLAVDIGWQSLDFQIAPLAGKKMAELIAGNYMPDILKPFRLTRFEH